jgi:hypothetical protein
MDEENEFTNKWSMFSTIICTLASSCNLELIKTNFLWLWEMKVLISEQPNINPVGLGNNSSSIDMATFATGYSSENDDRSMKLERDGSDFAFDDDFDEDEELTLAIPKKHSANPTEKKTPARPGKSKPTPSKFQPKEGQGH